MGVAPETVEALGFATKVVEGDNPNIGAAKKINATTLEVDRPQPVQVAETSDGRQYEIQSVIPIGFKFVMVDTLKPEVRDDMFPGQDPNNFRAPALLFGDTVIYQWPQVNGVPDNPERLVAGLLAQLLAKVNDEPLEFGFHAGEDYEEG